MPETFFLDTENGSQECRIITSLYSETRKKHYLIYEYIDGPQEETYISSCGPSIYS